MNRFTELCKQADAAFNAEYREQLDQLRREAQMVPAIDKQVYTDLIKIVEHATESNMAKAELCEQIRKLGDMAIGIAKKYLRLPL